MVVKEISRLKESNRLKEISRPKGRRAKEEINRREEVNRSKERMVKEISRKKEINRLKERKVVPRKVYRARAVAKILTMPARAMSNCKLAFSGIASIRLLITR